MKMRTVTGRVEKAETNAILTGTPFGAERGVDNIVLTEVNLHIRQADGFRMAPGWQKFQTMARGIFGGVGLQGMSGSINSAHGGHTFSKNGVIRRRVVPVQPNTTAQSLVKAVFSAIQAAWNALTQVEQEAWNLAKADWTISDEVMGVQRAPRSGRELYIHLNGNKGAGLTGMTAVPTLIDSPPTKETAGTTVISDVGPGLDGSTPLLEVNYTGALGANEKHVFQFTPQMSPGTSKLRPSKLRTMVVNDTSASPLALGTQYDAIYGPLVVGMKIGYRVLAINVVTGQRRTAGEGLATVASI